jgi:hypothetical protein
MMEQIIKVFFIEIPFNNAEVDVDVEEMSVGMVIGSVKQNLS